MFQAEQLPQANTWRYKRTLAGSWTLNIVRVKEVVGNKTDVIGCNAKMEPFMLIQCLNSIGVISFVSCKEKCHQCRI